MGFSKGPLYFRKRMQRVTSLSHLTVMFLNEYHVNEVIFLAKNVRKSETTLIITQKPLMMLIKNP